MRIVFGLVIALSIVSCAEEARVTDVDTTTVQLFEMVPASHSKVRFSNQVDETKYLNPLTYDTYLNGSGVALLDVNNDGLQDIFFSGNMVKDRLYLNLGDMQFEDITDKARITKNGAWSGGVAIADVNGDGWDDIYVCHYLFDDLDKRANALYINQGDGTFREKAKEYGVEDFGYSMMATFFDYDKDNDLDLYVGNQPPTSIYERKKYSNKIDYRFTDNFYRNDGGKFTLVTNEVGMRNFAYALSTTACDLNNDGWTDIYVANDYEEPDHMYINQGDGTFKNMVHESLRHMSNFSMGADVADINNDGWLDFFVADMVAKDHYRNKANMSGMNPEKFWGLANAGYHYQYMFNALQLNNGNGTFSEIAQLAGVSHTDWSWAALFFDMDNDGYRDLLVTNGQKRDTRNSDFVIVRDSAIAKLDPDRDAHDQLLEIIQMAPVTPLANYVYRNQGDLTFADMRENWGFTDKTFSNGAAYGDLDNDGDMDVVINNVNEMAFIYESKVNDLKLNNYLRITIDGPAGNTKGLNARATVRAGDREWMAELTPVRGYMSSVEHVFHFGLGDNPVLDYVSVVWPDGKMWEGTNIKANQVLDVKYANATGEFPGYDRPDPVFEEMEVQQEIAHAENDYDDYAIEVLLPYKLSTLGPVTATADVNGDGREDFFLGGSAGFPGQLFVQSANGQFEKSTSAVFDRDAQFEDGGAAFFDADADGDADLYVASGGNEFPAGSAMYQDRLYLNDGAGNFSRSGRLPAIIESTQAITAADFDGDGDTDIFVGARQVPQHYGHVPASVLLINDNNTYTDLASVLLPEEGLLGLVTDASWISLDGSDKHQLLVSGEWMPLTILDWNNSAFEMVDNATLGNLAGLWNRTVAADVDADGDLDIIAGNSGINIKYQATEEQPFKMFVNDFDNNGTNDVYLGYYDHDDGGLYPVRGRQCSSQQMPFVKKKFASYEEFASADLPAILEGRMEGTIEHAAQTFHNGIFYNDGDMNFRFEAFSNDAQIAPVHAIVFEDFNNDGNKDMFLAGNYYNREVETTRADAGTGWLFMGAPDGSLNMMHPSETGIIANRDVRDAFVIEAGGRKVLAIANNDSPMQFYTYH